jgi:hypothetical protein
MSSVAAPKRLIELISQSKFWVTALRKESDRLQTLGRLFGMPVIAVTAVTGTAIFSQLNENPTVWAKVVFGTVNLLAAVLSALQTYNAFPERAQKAKNSGEEFGNLFGQMLDAQDRIESGESVEKAELRALYDRYEALKKARPPVSERAQNQARRELRERLSIGSGDPTKAT